MDEQPSQPPDRPEAGSRGKRGAAGRFQALPFAERVLLAAALAVLAAFLIRGELALVFERWFDRLALLGALGVVLLGALRLLDAGFFRGRPRRYVLLVAALAPAAGFALDELTDVWRAAMLAGAAAMAWAGIKLATRAGFF